MAILSHDMWRTRFGGDPPPPWHDRAHQWHGLHRDRDRARALSRHRRGLEPNAVWIPTAMYGVASTAIATRRVAGCGVVDLIGRLAGDTSIDQAHAEVEGLAQPARSGVSRDQLGKRRPGSPGPRHPDAGAGGERAIVALLAGPPRSSCSSLRPTSPGCCSRAACDAGRRSQFASRSAPAAAG